MDTTGIEQDEYKALSVLTISMITGIVLFSIICLLVHYTRGSFVVDKGLAKTISVIDLLVVAVLIMAVRIIYRKRIDGLKEMDLVPGEKWESFRAVIITHLAICEIPALLSVICYLLFGEILFFLPVGAALVEMILKYPSRERVDGVINSGIFK